MNFQELALIEPLLAALRNTGYHTPTPIQQQAIPAILQRKDLLASAQTGTGKTAAFTLPLLQLMQNEKQEHPILRTLILTPTRELAIQIGESVSTYGCNLSLKHAVVYGGVPPQPQVKAIRRGVDILVATPGRLLDLLRQKVLSLSTLRYFVLDEADRMLDMGFLPEVQRIIAQLPNQKQSLFFSATLPPEMQTLAQQLLYQPVKVAVNPASTTAALVTQKVFFVEKHHKFSLLSVLLQDETITSLLVFTQMKHGADKLCRQLQRAGIAAEAIHGNKSQSARQAALRNFKQRKIRVLVATDIAARGIDIDDLTHVLNYDLPQVPETYVHRIGRTGRAGKAGHAFSFCDWSEKTLLKDIQQLIQQSLTVVTAHPFDVPGMHHRSQPASGQAANAPAITPVFRGRGGRRVFLQR